MNVLCKTETVYSCVTCDLRICNRPTRSYSSGPKTSKLFRRTVKEIESFSTPSEKILRGMMVLIDDTIKKKIVESIKQSKGFAILTDEVTDISNIQQLVTFVQYFDSKHW